MKHTKRVFLIHGWDGNPENHWFPWLKKMLSEEGFAVFSPQMPNAAHPKLGEWLATLGKVVILPDEDTYFVGHSLGCITIARYLASLREGVRVGGCVFVGGFSGNIGEPAIAEFYLEPFDVEAVKKHCRSFVSILSDNDEAVPLSAGREFHDQLGGGLIVEHKKGHFCSGDGVVELPSVLESLMEMSGNRAKV